MTKTELALGSFSYLFQWFSMAMASLMLYPSLKQKSNLASQAVYASSRRMYAHHISFYLEVVGSKRRDQRREVFGISLLSASNICQGLRQ